MRAEKGANHWRTNNKYCTRRDRARQRGAPERGEGGENERTATWTATNSREIYPSFGFSDALVKTGIKMGSGNTEMNRPRERRAEGARK